MITPTLLALALGPCAQLMPASDDAIPEIALSSPVNPASKTLVKSSTVPPWGILEENPTHRGSPHHLSVFLGGTDTSANNFSFTVGLDYEYRVSHLLGLGVVVEHAYGNIEATSFLAVADIHFTERFIAQIGPGIESSDTHGELVIARVGLLYETELAGFTFSPQIHYDWHDGEADALIVGFAFGLSF